MAFVSYSGSSARGTTSASESLGNAGKSSGTKRRVLLMHKERETRRKGNVVNGPDRGPGIFVSPASHERAKGCGHLICHSCQLCILQLEFLYTLRFPGTYDACEGRRGFYKIACVLISTVIEFANRS